MKKSITSILLIMFFASCASQTAPTTDEAPKSKEFEGQKVKEAEPKKTETKEIKATTKPVKKHKKEQGLDL